MKRYKYLTTFGKYSDGKIEGFELVCETEHYFTIVKERLNIGPFGCKREIDYRHEETISKPPYFGWWYDTFKEARQAQAEFNAGEVEDLEEQIKKLKNL